MRIAIEIITTNEVWCPSNTSSQGALRARDHRYDADETVTETAAAASRAVVTVVCGGGTAVRRREVAATAATARLQTTTTTPRSGHATVHFWRHCYLVVRVAAAASDGVRGTATRAALGRQQRPRRWLRRRGVPAAAALAAPPPPTTARHSHARVF